MGIFSRKSTTYVSSVAYPLGEDGEEDVAVLKQTVLNAVMQQRPIATSITQSYLNGQGIALRNAFRYARDHYTDGVPKSNAMYANEPDMDELRGILEDAHSGAAILFITSMVGTADYVWWAERHLAQTYGYDRVLKQFNDPPAGVEFDADVAYDLELDGNIRILLMNADGAVTTLIYFPTGLLRMANYVHSAYRTITDTSEAPVTTTRDAGAGETNSVTTTVTSTIVIGETRRTSTTVTVTIAGAVATVLTEVTLRITSRPHYFIYLIGSGVHPVVDTWLGSADLTSPYYPSVPLRVNSTDWVSEVRQTTDLYKTSKKLLKKLGLKIDSLAESINDNESVNDIDYSYVTFGVGLQVKSQEGQRYLYRFFEQLRNISLIDGDQYAEWKARFDALAGGGEATTNLTTPPVNMLAIYSEENRSDNHDIKLQWQYIDTNLVTGEVFPGARPGDVTVSIGGVRVEIELMVDIVLDNSRLVARKQIDENTYEELEIYGLLYENFIYNGKSVIITAYTAMTDPEENGFIVPLNQAIVRATPLVELTDLSYQCTHMVFNCYQIVKQKWYQTSAFKVIMVIAAIVLMIFFPPAGVVVMSTALAGTLAISILLATIIVATATVLIGMILMNLLTRVAIKLFGPKWGPIIAMILMFVSMNWKSIANMAANGAQTATITAAQVINASSMILNAYGAYAGGQMSAVQKKALGLETEFDKQMKEIEDLTKLNLDTSLDMIDIQGYTEATFNMFFEKHDTFITRTLLTGNDICDITAGLVENFADVGLMLPNTG